MTEKRYNLTTDDENFLVVTFNGKELSQIEVVQTLNGFIEENEQLKQELQKIYDKSTVSKVKSIVDGVYDDLLYETSEKSDYARVKVMECLEKIDDFGDDLND